MAVPFTAILLSIVLLDNVMLVFPLLTVITPANSETLDPPLLEDATSLFVNVESVIVITSLLLVA